MAGFVKLTTEFFEFASSERVALGSIALLRRFSANEHICKLAYKIFVFLNLVLAIVAKTISKWHWLDNYNFSLLVANP